MQLLANLALPCCVVANRGSDRDTQGHSYLATFDIQITKTMTEFRVTNQIAKMEADKLLNTMRFEKYKVNVYHPYNFPVQSKGHSPLRDT